MPEVNKRIIILLFSLIVPPYKCRFINKILKDVCILASEIFQVPREVLGHVIFREYNIQELIQLK